ncbi:hypothetical protein [Vibrio diabolicus]|uniref:hypothetical protein n=1 Tax=Vibrio diabolicus TaxID=50719 RepID=UPI0015F41F23|nr:hypothetical protein [Vibrio diabolicus]
MRKKYIPQPIDFVSIALGIGSTLLITGGIHISSDSQEEASLLDPPRVELLESNTDGGAAQAYATVYSLYERYYAPPKEKNGIVEKEKANSKKDEKDTLAIDNKLYQLQATFIAEQAMAVIMIKTKEGKVENTVLLKEGEKIAHYLIAQVNRTEVVLVSEHDQNPLHLKLFERDINK